MNWWVAYLVWCGLWFVNLCLMLASLGVLVRVICWYCGFWVGSVLVYFGFD